MEKPKDFITRFANPPAFIGGHLHGKLYGSNCSVTQRQGSSH